MAAPRLRHLAPAVLGALTLVAGAAAPVSAVAPLFVLHTYIGSGCADVTGAPASTFVTLEQQTSSGAVLESFMFTSDAQGEGGACFEEAFYPGMKLSGRVNSTTRVLTVPKLTMAVDRATDVVSGKAPAGESVRITLHHYTTFTASTAATITRTASSKGTYSADATAQVNLIGGDRIESTVVYATGDTVELQNWVPRIGVRIGSPALTAYTLMSQSGTVTLKTSKGDVRAKAVVANDGSGPDTTALFTSGGVAVATRVGDVVSAPFTGGPSFTIGSVTIAVDVTTDVVSGSCLASKPILIRYWNTSPIKNGQVGATCGSGGTYSVDLTASVDVQPSDRILVISRTSAGDTIERLRIAG